MDPVAAETARQTYDLDVHASSNLDDAPFAGETFDVVTMWDVLEHVPRPRAALAQIRRWLKPEGWLLLRTPNAGSLQARFWGRFWAGFDAPRHLVAFDPDTLTAILQAQGFSVRRIWAPSGSFALAMFSLRFWLRARGFPVGWARWVDNPPVQMLSGPLFWLADRAGGGGQMMIAAKKMKG
jgi:SAM-dependent methyltransferase